ncbi:hypothetical protein RB594_001063 [Gaeumannomyces avenae]
MLPQGAGVLDIDKVVEYREPEYQLGQWLRPRAPQLQAASPRDPREPVDFVALECSSCKKAIQGSHFECVGDGCACTHTHGSSVFCETCSREPNSKHRPDILRKVHKRCVLSDYLSEEAAQRACRCPNLGAPSKPEDTTYSSSSSGGPGSERLQRSLFPFGAGDRDRHEQTSKGGVLFSIRDRLQLHPVDTPASSVKQCYALGGNRPSLWFAKEYLPRHRRVKAFMKQVASSPFWGVGGASDTSMEARIVRAVAEAGLTYAENPRKSARFNEQRKASLKASSAFPFNAWSVAQLHLCRERRFYAPAFFGNAAAAAAQLSLDGWRRNRLDVLEAVRTLGVVAVAMRASPVFRHACRWSFAPRGLVFPDDRGGRRAQPASHLYEHSMLHDCTVAGWADLAPREQVAAYVALRDARAVDVDGVIKKAAREDARRRAQPPPGGKGAGREAYEAGDVVLEGHDGSGAQVYYDGQGTCDCVCDAAGHCDVNAGVDYTNGGEAFTADGFVPFEIGDGDGNVGR